MDSALAFITAESSAIASAQSHAESIGSVDRGSVHSSRFSDSLLDVTPRPGSRSSTLEVSPYDDTLRGSKAILLTSQLTVVMLTNSMVNGIVTIGITTTARDLALDPSLVYWPVLAYTLTSSPLMLPFGSIADVLGAKKINLVGCICCGVFVLACGLARSGLELIVFRAMHGIGAALTLPTSMSIVSTSLASGKLRNISLSCLGIGQSLGYALGLVLSGVFIETVGWRFGFWLVGALQLVMFVIGVWAVPNQRSRCIGEGSAWYHLRQDIDWVGAGISCACIGLLAYVLAMIAESTAAVQQPANIALLSLSVLLMPVFAAWMNYQERREKPALIPNSLWKTAFTSLCIMVTFTYAEMQCMELLTSLFFQNIQMLNPLETSLRLLPGTFVGIIFSMTTGNLIHKMSVSWLVVTMSIFASAAPLIMAIADPAFPYWYEAFPAQILYPVCVDVIFVVGALIVAEVFPERDQALAGAVFNTIANLGQAIGLALIAVISNTVTSGQPDSNSTEAYLEGYRAGFFTSFAWMLMTAVIGVGGLRKMGKIGLKRD